jgi:tetratricopeptide (TPR) repeat protein
MPPNRDEVLTKVGFCYSKMKMFERAQFFFRQALEINPKNETARAFMYQQTSPDGANGTGTRIEGKYLVEGQNPNGSKYNGTASINRSEDGYSISWDIASEPFAGRSFSDKTLAVKWAGNGGKSGVAIYTPTADGTLRGMWASGTGLETLIPVK